MAVATLLRHTELGQFSHLLAATHFLDRAVSATHVDPAVTLAVLAILHMGGNRTMALLENLMRPLLNAQRAAGREEGEAAGREEGTAAATAQFEAWKKRQRAAGVQFVDDDEQSEDPQKRLNHNQIARQLAANPLALAGSPPEPPPRAQMPTLLHQEQP